MRKFFILSGISTALFLGICLLPSFPFKIFLAGLLLSLACIFLAIALHHPIPKYTCILLFSCVIAITLFEGYCSILTFKFYTPPAQAQRTQGKANTQQHPYIGYRPSPNNVYTVEAVRQGALVYKATYTTNALGWRITPEHPQATKAVVLLGCSYTHGDGLNDTDTMAWKLGQILGSDYQVFNLSYTGYGPNNMLAIVEHALPDLQKYQQILSYFIVLDDHGHRVAGASPWGRTSPLYEIHHGKAVFAGNFLQDQPLPWERKHFTWLKQSATVTFHRRLLSEKTIPRNTSEKRLELMRAVLNTAAEKLQNRYTQNISTVLVWPTGNSRNFAQSIAPLSSGLKIIDMEPWLPNYAKDKSIYQIPNEGHPNSLANDIMAKNLVKLVQEQK